VVTTFPSTSVMSHNEVVSTVGVIALPKPEAGAPLLFGCPQLLIQYICNYPPYLEAVPSIRNSRTRHAVMTGTHITLLTSDKLNSAVQRVTHVQYMMKSYNLSTEPLPTVNLYMKKIQEPRISYFPISGSARD
jgi:hypothetical protein